MAEKGWTDALLERLAATRPRKEVEPYQVTARIARIGLDIARLQDEAFGRFGLNRGEVGVLGALLLAGSAQLSPTQLFKGLMLSSAGITSRLDRLERAGYVRRSRHPADRRGVLVSITEAGRKVFEKAVAADLEGETALLAPLTKADQRVLVSLLRTWLGGLEPESPTAG